MQALIKSERKTAQNSEINLSILVTYLLFDGHFACFEF
jgi:hypothetical protein